MKFNCAGDLPTPRTRFARRSSHAALLLLSASLAAFSFAAPAVAENGPAATAAAASANSRAKERRYRGTRPIVVDKATGRARLPTQQEVAELVEDLATLAVRPEEGLQQTVAESGAVVVDLEGGFGGVMLARPNDSGGWETSCVFTFEEGAAFLGLVEDQADL